ncbi:hypothetical protein SteCoe_2746 [Stentor coeruleus]|uniref:Uncharacterized protein n=1 Tax=Stentor coeruleus TaxID=5963 RepID=A0A1R2CYQ1_9CILI|nr:hypothetical protein SteCoe_2746 [Stentor coeruleus]
MEKPYPQPSDPNYNYQGGSNYPPNQPNPSMPPPYAPPYSNQPIYPPSSYNQPQIYPPPSHPAFTPQYGGPPGPQYPGAQQVYVQSTPVIGITTAVVAPTVIIPTIGITTTPNEYSERERKRGRFANRIRYLIIGKLVADILLALSIAPLFLLAIQAILGYFGARNMNKVLCIIYLILLCIIFIIRIGLMFIVPVIFVIVIFSLLCIFDIVVFVFYVRFTHMVVKMHEHERMRVLSYMQYIRSGRCCYI